MKVKDFVAMFKGLDQDAEVAIAGAPDVTSWFNEPVPFLGTSRVKGKLWLIVGATECTVTPKEPKVVWPGRPV